MPDEIDAHDSPERKSAQQTTIDQPETVSHFDSETGSGRPVRGPVEAIEPGSSIGRFQLLDVLGHGGFGKVYRALDPRLEREVAIKVPRRDLFESNAERERFLREARSAAKVQHPNVCPIYEIDETDGKTYLVMALVDGECLSRRIRSQACSSSAAAARLVLKVARAVQAAHSKGIIHRDLKPSNIMIDERGEPIVVDFGLARRLESQDLRVTYTGELLGTPAYMSPEQAAGGAVGAGSASDVYSLGVIFYELLCGRTPFAGSPVEVLAQILRDVPPPPSRFEPRLDQDLEAICLKAMARKPEDRYSSMSDLAAALENWLVENDSQLFRPRRRTPPAFRPFRLSFSRPLVLAGSVICMIIFFMSWLLLRDGGNKAVGRASTEKIFLLGGWCMTNANGESREIHNAKDLPQDLSTIEKVWLDSDAVRKVVDSDLADLAGLTGLKELYLGHSHVTGEGLRHLVACRELWAVDLNSSKLDDRGIANVRALAAIRHLDCGETAISDDGIIHLKSLPINTLHLQGTRISDAGMKSVAQIRTLETLMLQRTQIGDLGVKEIQRLARLVTLQLNDTLLTDAGLAWLPRSLKSLHIVRTSITNEGLRVIGQLSELEILDLSGCHIEAGLQHLQSCQMLRELSLHETDVSDAGIAKLTSLRRLRYLGATNTTVSGRGLGQFQALNNLALSHSGLNAAGLAEISTLSKLQFLNLFENDLDDTDVTMIAQLVNLIELDLENNKLTDAAVPEISKLKQLKRLGLSGNPSITPAALDMLRTALPACQITY